MYHERKKLKMDRNIVYHFQNSEIFEIQNTCSSPFSPAKILGIKIITY